MSTKEALAAFAAASADDLPRLLLRAARAVSQRLAGELNSRGHGAVRPAHATVFAHLDAEGTHVSVLAERAEMTRQGMSALVAELTEAGYLRQEVDPADKRATLVLLTDAGEALCHGLAITVLGEMESEWQKLLGVEGLRDLRAALRKLGAIGG